MTPTDPPVSRTGESPVPPAVPGEPIEAIETRDWIESLDDVLFRAGPERVGRLLKDLQAHAQYASVVLPVTSVTPYVNSIPPTCQLPYPGDLVLERRIKSLVRWNAMAMVVRANKREPGIGGHISTYASSATLYEVGFNHFFRARRGEVPGDFVYFQGHSAPGIYARAFLEGRLTAAQLENFRRELQPGGGLPSYPHPWLMPDFWSFPTVSMGLGPLMAIYHARFIRYLEDRGLAPPRGSKVWVFLGDGECDEPETLGAITLAARERLDNLIFVVNCNLQRLDGPVRGNGKIIQELEAAFRGSGWNVLKVIWGSEWDPLFAADADGLLARRAAEAVDGDYQKYSVSDGAYIREHFFGAYPALRERVRGYSDGQLRKLRRGGHDPVKVWAAYQAAVHHVGAPSVILAKTVKGYGLGEVGEGRNITHQQKKLNEEELLKFRDRFDIPLSDDEVTRLSFYRPPDDSAEMRYLRERREALGGFIPRRAVFCPAVSLPPDDLFREFHEGTGDRAVSTTMAFVRLLTKLLKDPALGRLVVPIVPDEARTFGMEALFRQCGIYSHVGQLYEPVDKDTVLYYKEARDGQILEEGITEAGSLASFIAAGTAYANHGVPAIPVFLFYSMFGFQRVGDFIWAAGDSRCRGFLVGATSGRTTLAGEGLQHQDGHSHLLAYPLPNLLAYDPAYAYEIAVIVREGLRRMGERQESVFYYLTVGNENYPQPPMPPGAQEGILRGMYRLRNAPEGAFRHRARLLGSGPILNEVLKAQALLAERYGVAAEVWSVTSYKELRRDALEAERWNLLHPAEPPRVPYVAQCLSGGSGPVVAASDFVKALPDLVARWVPAPFDSLGTEGYGRSDGRAALRDFFEVDARYVTLATLRQLAVAGAIPAADVARAVKDLGIDPDKPNPMTA